MCPLWALALVLALAEGAGKLGWAGRPGTATAGRMGHGVLGAGCWLRRSAATGGTLGNAHWAAHTGHGVLSRPQGTCTCSLICLLPSTFLRAAALALAGLAGIMAAASAHQVCEASNMILTWIFSLLFHCLITVVPRVEYGQVLLPLLTFSEAALMNIADLLCYRILWYYYLLMCICAEPRNCGKRLGQPAAPWMFAVAICCRQQHGIRYQDKYSSKDCNGQSTLIFCLLPCSKGVYLVPTGIIMTYTDEPPLLCLLCSAFAAAS